MRETFINKKYVLGNLTVTSCTVLIVSFFFCFANVFSSLAGMWWNNAVYSHGMLVPLISGYMIWLKRKTLASAEVKRNFSGIVLILTGLLLLLIGKLGGIWLFQELSIVVVLTGIILFNFGTDYMKTLSVPILYLLFMLTFWGEITNRLHMPLQLFSARLGTFFMQSIGIPVYRHSVFMELPNITLEVAEECSGVNYLIAVVALGIPLGYFSFNDMKRRIILVVFGTAIAILGNSVRIGFIGTLAYYNMAGDLHGPYHVLQAMLVSVIGYAALFVGVILLSKFPSSVATEKLQENICVDSKIFTPGSSVNPASVLTVVLLLSTGIFLNNYKPVNVPLKSDLKLFPYKISGWEGREIGIETLFQDMFETDFTLSREYKMNNNNASLKLYIGYLEAQQQGKELINYKSERLHKGVAEVVITTLHGETIIINRVVKDKETFFFWYDLNGKIVSDRNMAKLYTIYDSFKNRTNGTVIIVSTKEYSSGDKIYENSVIDFVSGIIPSLRRFLP